jgi:hypothetical protein
MPASGPLYADPCSPTEGTGGGAAASAGRSRLDLRCFVMLAVAGDLIVEFATRHQRSGVDSLTSDALAELVSLSDHIASAVAGLARWDEDRAAVRSVNTPSQYNVAIAQSLTSERQR